MKPCIEEEYIYPSCAPGYWLSRAAKNVPNGTYSLFRARSPILLGYMHLGKILSSGLKCTCRI